MTYINVSFPMHTVVGNNEKIAISGGIVIEKDTIYNTSQTFMIGEFLGNGSFHWTIYNPYNPVISYGTAMLGLE